MNELEVKKKIGRPPRYKTNEELEAIVEEYFTDCDKDRRPYTVTGLANALEIDRDTLLQYEGKPEFVGTVKRAKEKIRQSIEEKLLTVKTSPVV